MCHPSQTFWSGLTHFAPTALVYLALRAQGFGPRQGMSFGIQSCGLLKCCTWGSEVFEKSRQRHIKPDRQQFDVAQARLHSAVFDGGERFLLHADLVTQSKLADLLLVAYLPDSLAEALADIGGHAAGPLHEYKFFGGAPLRYAQAFGREEGISFGCFPGTYSSSRQAGTRNHAGLLSFVAAATGFSRGGGNSNLSGHVNVTSMIARKERRRRGMS